MVRLGGRAPKGGASGRLICSSSWPWGPAALFTTSKPLRVSNLTSGDVLPHSEVVRCSGTTITITNGEECRSWEAGMRDSTSCKLCQDAI